MASEGSPKRILVIQTAFLGDIVLSTGFLRDLRAAYPASEICYLTTPIGEAILRGNPWGLRVLVYDKKGRDRGFIAFLKKSREVMSLAPDLVFSLHRSFRSTLLAKAAGGETWGFREANFSALLTRTVERPRGVLEGEKNAQLLARHLTKAPGLPYPVLYCTEEDRAAVLALQLPSRYLVLCPDSVWATKRWPAEKFAALARAFWEKYSVPSVLLGSATDVGEEVRKAYGAGAAPGLVDLMGKTNMGALKAVISGARMVVSNDSAPLHVAAAFGVPVLGVFGPTTKDLGFFPHAPENRWAVAEISTHTLACRPCGLHGHDRCPQGHFRCMLELNSAAVFAKAEELYAATL